MYQAKACGSGSYMFYSEALNTETQERVELEQKLHRAIDTDAGIPDNIKEFVYDPFFTTKEIDRVIGQGLAIAHAVIVHAQSGTIDFDSSPAGTTFVIRMPLDPTRSDDEP